MAVEGLGLRVEEVPVQQLAQLAVEIVLRHALRQAEAQHDFTDELLVALHTYKVSLASQQPLHHIGVVPNERI